MPALTSIGRGDAPAGSNSVDIIFASLLARDDEADRRVGAQAGNEAPELVR